MPSREGRQNESHQQPFGVHGRNFAPGLAHGVEAPTAVEELDAVKAADHVDLIADHRHPVVTPWSQRIDLFDLLFEIVSIIEEIPKREQGRSKRYIAARESKFDRASI